MIAEGRFVYVSGQGALDGGDVTATTIEEQTKIVIGKLATVLETAGATLADVVQCRVYLTDIRDFSRMDKVYRESLPEPLPARTTIGVAALPIPGMLVEIDCVAVLPRSG
jgi:2-iminobutanoate/2-iminopropanoate deaminase